MSTPFVAPLRVAFVPGVTPGKWVGIWKDRHPRAPLELVPVSVSDQRAALTDGIADVVFARLPVERDGLSVIRLYEEQPVVVAPSDHVFESVDSVVVADLVGENVLTGTDRDAVELVSTGIGVLVLPQSIARLHARKDVIARPITDAPTTEIAIAWPTELTTDAVEEFVGIVRGRTAASSRGTPTPPAEPAPSKPRAPKRPAPKSGVRTGVRRPRRPR
jgi:DNA-binding transcriptional LysR family regulator